VVLTPTNRLYILSWRNIPITLIDLEVVAVVGAGEPFAVFEDGKHGCSEARDSSTC